MTQTQVRNYSARAASTETFGRVLVSARDQHLIIDGPVQNGCPGEAITPPEAFLGGVASCGVELVQVIARDQNIGLQRVPAEMPSTSSRPSANVSRTPLAPTTSSLGTRPGWGRAPTCAWSNSRSASTVSSWVVATFARDGGGSGRTRGTGTRFWLG